MLRAFKNALNIVIDWVERYQAYKLASVLSTNGMSKKEVDQAIMDIFDFDPRAKK